MAQSSRFFKIDDDVLMEFIYHDQADPFEIEVDDNGSEVMILESVAGDGLSSRSLLSELGADVVNFDVTLSGSYIAIEGFAKRTLLLQSSKTYKFNLSTLTQGQIDGFTIESNVSTSLGAFNIDGQIATFTPSRNTINGEVVEYKLPGFIGGQVIVSEKANPLFATPDEDTGNDINQVKGRYHAIRFNDDSSTYALLGYDSTGGYSKYNFIDNYSTWTGSTGQDLIQSQTLLTSELSSIKYDSIRLHLRSGASFAARGYDGFLFEIKVERSSGVKNNLTQLVYLNQSNYEISNPKPFVLGETLYTKFISVKVPTIVNQYDGFNRWFYPDVSNPDGDNGTDLQSTANYEVSFKLIDQVRAISGFDFIQTGEENTFVVSREDEYSDFAVAIEDASDGDYFKIYPTLDESAARFGNWVLTQINNTSDDISVFFDVELYEQVGTSNIKTFETTYVKNEEFDQPISFRPVILNANVAVNFSIDVDLRIYNQTDNTQIIKKASATFNQAAKYGKKLGGLKINSANKLTEVYNVLPNLSVNRAIRGLISESTPKTTKYVPTFIERHNILTSATQVDLLTSETVNDNAAQVEDLDSPEFKSSGEAEILVPPFTTYYKFVIGKKRGDDIEFVDFTQANELVLSFSDGNTRKQFRDISNRSIDMSNGEILFKIDQSNTQSIRGMQNKEFYISIDTGNGVNNETMVTWGRFKTS